MAKNSSGDHTLSKEERLCSKKSIDNLFTGGNSRSMSAFPLRLVYMTTALSSTNSTPLHSDAPQAQMLVSVSKRHFRHAVDRNRAKRQVREAYRNNKHLLLDVLAQQPDRGVRMAFIWMADEQMDSPRVGQSIKGLLLRLAEKMKNRPAKAKPETAKTATIRSSHEPEP